MDLSKNNIIFMPFDAQLRFILTLLRRLLRTYTALLFKYRNKKFLAQIEFH
jgi:hypothetical protein